MPGSRRQDRIRPPLWDRLMVDPAAVTAAALRIDSRELVAAVRRDVERLLNTRRMERMERDDLPEGTASLLTYGLPDLSIYSGRSTGDRAHICGLITTALKRFEPRLLPNTIRVDYVEGGQTVGLANASQARFRIRGTLYYDPLRLPVAFDTDLDMETSEFHLEEALDA